MAVRADLNLSLDGIAVTSDQTPENPFGDDWGRLVAAYTGTRTFQQRVFHDESGSGTTGIDDRYAQEYFEGIGAEIMGAGMFGFHNFPDDPNWRGWWGDEPPFHYPVLVLTQTPRPPIEFENGTRFDFRNVAPLEALEEARGLAGEEDIRIGGGASVVRDFLRAGLIDRLHVALAPIVIGRGTRLWDDLHQLEDGFAVSSELAESGVVHVTFRR
ncbi:MAG TPA: dihydrofolate reductase family protein [Galbitalea sp.]|jgi:dihydrofolate reductase